ncbi:MAG: translation initiation factor IF-2 [Eubacteriaceae bacterium]|nr:translation initiation factor IF-2 [Eubacteriaceae bacterium]
MSKKVYELAKEFGVQSKEFASMLQGINIPVKNHMSVMTDQQEKYFRNNFLVVEGKIAPISEADRARSEAVAASQAAAGARAPEAKPETKAEPPKRENPSQGTAQETAVRKQGSSVRQPQGRRNDATQANTATATQQAERPAQNQRQGQGQQQRREQRPQDQNAPRRDGQGQAGYNNRRPPQQGTDQERRQNTQQRQQGQAGQYQGDNRQRSNYQGQRQQNQGQNQNQRQPYQGQNQGQQAQGQQNQGQRQPSQGQRSQYQGQNQNQRQPYQGQNQQRNQGGQRQGSSNQQGQGQRTYNNNRDTNRPYNPNQQRQGGGQQGQRQTGVQNRPFNGQNRPPQSGGAARTQQQPGQRRPAATSSGQTGVEKTKSSTNKKENKQKTEQRTAKAKDNLFNDTTTRRTIDNTKRVKGSKSTYRRRKIEAREERLTGGAEGLVMIPPTISVSELAEKVLLSPVEVLKCLMNYGIMANINQIIDFETAWIVCEELGIELKLEEEQDVFADYLEKHMVDENKLVNRGPIITVMGHVDHGKTSLLDAIRQTSVAAGESGGITQRIGAYTIDINGMPITFIDTPGHEAFTAMRSRGASVTDIAVLVIAADDGVKPQTVEAINHAKEADVPIIVAINKIDKPEGSVDRVKQELTEYGLVCEEWGGDTICVGVSARTGEGISDLLDNILLVAEYEDLKANFEEKAVGTVIEARIDKQRGISVTLLVKSGTLSDSDTLVAGSSYGRVKVMQSDTGERIKKAEPSRAVEVLGFDEVPFAGEKFYVVENEREAKRITDRRKDWNKLNLVRNVVPATFDELFSKITQGQMKEVKLIVKADLQGSFEALKQSLEKLNENDYSIRVNAIHGGVGSVTESDVSLAVTSSAILAAFNVKTEPSAAALALKENIEIRNYEVIYALIEDIEKAMLGLRDPEYREVATATAEVRQTFKVPDLGFVAGCYVTSGTISRRDKARVNRGRKTIFDGPITSLKRFKDDVREVATGYECGVGLEKFNDLAIGDVLEFYKIEEIMPS